MLLIFDPRWVFFFFLLRSGSMFSGVFVIVGNLHQLGAETNWETLTGCLYYTGQRRWAFTKLR